MPSFYEDLCRRLKERGLLQVWERSRAIALAAGTFAIPVNRATEACENWKLKFPDRTWEELRNLINAGLLRYQNGDFSEVDPKYYYWGETDNVVKTRTMQNDWEGIVQQVQQIIDRLAPETHFSITVVDVDENGNITERVEGFTEDGRTVEVSFWTGGQGQEPVALEPGEHRFFCGLGSVSSIPIPELETKICEECVYFCRVGADINCNAFHQLLEANHCPDYQRK